LKTESSFQLRSTSLSKRARDEVQRVIRPLKEVAGTPLTILLASAVGRTLPSLTFKTVCLPFRPPPALPGACERCRNPALEWTCMVVGGAKQEFETTGNGGRAAASCRIPRVCRAGVRAGVAYSGRLRSRQRFKQTTPAVFHEDSGDIIDGEIASARAGAGGSFSSGRDAGDSCSAQRDAGFYRQDRRAGQQLRADGQHGGSFKTVRELKRHLTLGTPGEAPCSGRQGDSAAHRERPGKQNPKLTPIGFGMAG